MASGQPLTETHGNLRSNPKAGLIEDFWKRAKVVFPDALPEEAEQWIVFVQGRRIRLEGRQVWRSKAAACGAVHRAFKKIKFRGERFSYGERAALVEQHVEFQRIA